MAKKISSLLGVTTSQLEKCGAFDGFIDVDSKLHVDPSLIEHTEVPEFSTARKTYNDYFTKVFALIKQSKHGDKLLEAAHKRLTFEEIPSTGLGYSKKGTRGSAIGPQLAANILDTSRQIIAAGIEDPIIFELVGMLEDGIGADRISDMTVSILFNHFAEYSARVGKQLNAKLNTYTIRGVEYQLPFNPETGTEIILVPKKILRHLPLALDWDDVDLVSAYNEDLRRKLNERIGETWKSAAQVPKAELKKLLIENPELLNGLLKQYKGKPRESYDFFNDPLGEIQWAGLSERAAQQFPLNFATRVVTPENILDVVRTICRKFGDLIENNGWFMYLHDHHGKQKPERAAQLLFYGIAESYCEANNLDLNREINAGIGSLDFKISRGYNAKVNVEVKYSTNNLVKGFEKQLPAYNKAEKTETSIYLVIQTSDNTTKIDELLKLEESKRNAGEKVPEVIVIDGRKQVTASKRK